MSNFLLKLPNDCSEAKKINWHKERAARAESWSNMACRELGISRQDLKDYSQKKRAH